MRTRLFVRPGWADILEFYADRPTGEVHGSFSRSWKLPFGRRWTSFEVHAEGASDLDPVPKLLGDLGQIIIAPFEFSIPSDLRLDGRIEREDFGATPSAKFLLFGHSSSDWKFQNFPLTGTNFRADYTDERLLIAPFSAGVARGALGGRIELSGPAEAKRVAFDLNIEHAHLGESIRTVELWTADRAGEEARPESEFPQQIADGSLKLSLFAEGPANNPMGFWATAAPPLKIPISGN
ncbi:MAG: hypothetical protein J6386_22885 [Candidatus Synoicihabitans palmerolidicus]|nr:hypothetical protein [Candidatus Synoicihabitans palmerolidicus]